MSDDIDPVAMTTLSKLGARIAELEAELDTWRSVFPDIAPEQVLPDRSKLEAENARLRALLGTADNALFRAAVCFGRYAQLHRAKGTPEGDQKAETNEAMANEMTAALAAIRESEKGDDNEG